LVQVLAVQEADARGLDAEQQHEGAGGSDVEGHGGVVEALAKLVPALVVTEDADGFLTRDARNDQGLGEAPVVRPAEEVANRVVAAVAVGEPLVEVGLGELVEGESSLVEPGQQFEGDADLGAQVGAAEGRSPAAGGAAAGASEQEPVDERADEAGVLGRPVGEQLVEPGGDAVEFLVALGQDAGVDEGLADVVLVAAGWQLVEQVVAERPPRSGEFAEELRVRAALEPAEDAAGVVGRGEGLQHGPKLGVDLATRTGEVLAEPLSQHAAWAASVGVEPSAASAGWAEVDAGQP
jgi:hypothetical protein